MMMTLIGFGISTARSAASNEWQTQGFNDGSETFEGLLGPTDEIFVTGKVVKEGSLGLLRFTGYIVTRRNNTVLWLPMTWLFNPRTRAIISDTWRVLGRPTFSTPFPNAIRFPGTPPVAAAVSQNASGQPSSMSRDGRVVVGFYDNGFSTPYHAFRWTEATDVVDLGTLDPANNASRSSFATDTNSDGAVIVGYSDIAGGVNWHAFRWTQAGGMIDLGAANGAASFSRAFGTSTDGTVVVGEGDFPGGFGNIRQAFRWTQTGGFQRLGSVQPDWPSVANAVTGDGSVIIGHSGFPLVVNNRQSNTTRAFRWTQAAGMQNLGVLPGFEASTATAVSDDGAIVVGFCTNGIVDRNAPGGRIRGDSATSRAFYWTQQNGMRDLTQLLNTANVLNPGVSFVSATGMSLEGDWINTLVVGPTTPANEFGSAVVSLVHTFDAPSPPPSVASSRIVNLAARAQAGSGGDALICGFVIGPGSEKQVLVRAVGPALSAAPFNLAGTLADPVLTLFGPDSATRVAASNDNWESSIAPMFGATGAFALPTGSRDAAIVTRLTPGSYTAQVTSLGNTSGLALIEIYDADPASSATSSSARLINTAVRARVGGDADALIPGVVISGPTPKTVLIRAVGPTLGAAPFEVAGALAEPVVTLFSGAQSIANNRGWGTATNAGEIRNAARNVGAFPIPDGSRDSALLMRLNPGAYTVQVSGANESAGVALVEVYEVP
jgi:probable HAF family extracellular repeat protein